MWVCAHLSVHYLAGFVVDLGGQLSGGGQDQSDGEHLTTAIPTVLHRHTNLYQLFFSNTNIFFIVSSGHPLYSKCWSICLRKACYPKQLLTHAGSMSQEFCQDFFFFSCCRCLTISICLNHLEPKLFISSKGAKESTHPEFFFLNGGGCRI